LLGQTSLNCRNSEFLTARGQREAIWIRVETPK